MDVFTPSFIGSVRKRLLHDVMYWAHTNFFHHNHSVPKDTATLNISFRCACMWSHKSEPGRCKNADEYAATYGEQVVACEGKSFQWLLIL